MKLTANITRENVALSAPDGYADAGTTQDGSLAALEVEIDGEVRIYERDASHVRPGDANGILTLGFANGEHMRRVAMLMLQKSGAPALTAREWAIAVDALLLAAGKSAAPRASEEFEQLADKIASAT